MSECGVEDCGKPVYKYAVSSGLCRGHYARRAKGRDTSTPLRQWADPRRTLMEAAFAFADASELDDALYLAAWKRLYAAARRILRTK